MFAQKHFCVGYIIEWWFLIYLFYVNLHKIYNFLQGFESEVVLYNNEKSLKVLVIVEPTYKFLWFLNIKRLIISWDKMHLYMKGCICGRRRKLSKWWKKKKGLIFKECVAERVERGEFSEWWRNDCY